MSGFHQRTSSSSHPVPAHPVPAHARGGGRRKARLVLSWLAWLASCRAPEAAPPRAEEPSIAAAAADPTPSSDATATTPAPALATKADPVAADPAPDPAAGGLAPLTDEQAAILFGSQEDQEPELRGGITESLADLHYLSGNEKTLDAFYSALKDVGGGYVGVGTDQAYFFMGWARFEIAWLIDYDPAVQQVHELYRLFFMASATPAELMALWDEDHRDQALALIDAAHDEAKAKPLRYWYRSARARISQRLENVERRMIKAGVPSFLTDQEHFDYVRMMLEQRRVRPMLVDLHADQGLVSLAQSAEQLGVPIRVLYLSNAEQYWKRYPKQYRTNIAALKFADDGMVLRTLLSQSANVDYRYNVQPGANYQEWLSKPFVGNVYQIVRKGPKASPKGITLFETTEDPDDSAVGRSWHAKHDG